MKTSKYEIVGTKPLIWKSATLEELTSDHLQNLLVMTDKKIQNLTELGVKESAVTMAYGNISYEECSINAATLRDAILKELSERGMME